MRVAGRFLRTSRLHTAQYCNDVVSFAISISLPFLFLSFRLQVLWLRKSPEQKHHIFLSHYQAEGADQCKSLFDEL